MCAHPVSCHADADVRVSVHLKLEIGQCVSACKTSLSYREIVLKTLQWCLQWLTYRWCLGNSNETFILHYTIFQRFMFKRSDFLYATAEVNIPMTITHTPSWLCSRQPAWRRQSKSQHPTKNITTICYFSTTDQEFSMWTLFNMLISRKQHMARWFYKNNANQPICPNLNARLHEMKLKLMQFLITHSFTEW